ncbi:hypothetical protein [Mucilaginibacter pocheonensis]|uniref:YwiC-like protein n=1 Tax=Mucilaginibacter pocheonensis TaxID=398050 RepID=A0ABU1T842_9SPHI|nr:hypothetical protein [Mucilaginibacter pocheonensis]MDR6941559.1 hypothetical protein [Mucilaginibacter pocheonensis]
MKNNLIPKQPWLHSPGIDGMFILSPPFIALLLVICFPAQFQAASAIPIYYWLFLVVFIDVAHVYSTLYRTYFNLNSYKNDAFLIVVPIACYIVGVLLHSFDGMLFWRILAYLAVFHFIRQQYGFMRLYSRQEDYHYWYTQIDKLAIYTSTIYPLFYWHFAGKRNFSWFVENDIVSIHSPILLNVGLASYLTIIVAYLIKECIYVVRIKTFNLPRNLLIGGTFLSWYFGIVYFNGDMAFTTLNVVSHGIPYMALIWIFEKSKQAKDPAKGNLIKKYTFNKVGGVLIFLLLLALFAYIEEGLWDGLIWKEHGSIFTIFSSLPKINDQQMLSLLVPLLALPQSTHYVLDGFIWKIKKAAT